MVITLIGYRGSGKTTVARPLAQRLGWDWIDADTVIEQTAGRTIREIFADQGEPAFRELERQVMAELLGRDRLVIAAGGGAILNPETRSRLTQAGPVVWLQASLQTLQARIEQDVTTAERRPNLTNSGGLAEIAQVLAIREPLYQDCATLTLDTDAAPIANLVDQIVAHLPSPFRA
jgi:shikimate kinase